MRGVEIRTGTTVTGLDRARGTVRLGPGARAATTLAYDRLVLATGAEAVIPDFPVSGTRGRYRSSTG